MSDEVPGREATAEQEGRDAYQTGVPQHQNPYVATFAQSEARLAWLTGWLAAEGREATLTMRVEAECDVCGTARVMRRTEDVLEWLERHRHLSPPAR